MYSTAISVTHGANGSVVYVIWGIIALLILGYLLYSLFKPEKF